MLTRRHGKVRAVAKGVRRTKSKFGSRLEPFSHVDLQLYTGRNLDIVSQAESIRSYGNDVVDDYPAYTAGTAVLETADRLTAEEKEPSLRLFLLVIGALRALADRTHPAGLVLDAFLLRAMSVAGWEPALDRLRPLRASPARTGTSPCRPAAWSARPAGPTGSAMPNPVTIELLDALLTGDWDAPRRARAPTAGRRSGLVAALLQWHLERGLRSLPLVDWSDRAACAGRGPVAKREVKAPNPHPSGARPPRSRPDKVPEARRDRHGRQRPLGQGRAACRGRPGHEAGESSLFDCVEGAIELGVTAISAYAFSTENWRRSPDEVRFLMGFNRDVIRRRRDEMHELGVRVRWAGRRPRLWRSVIKELEVAEELTRDNDVLTLTMCVNYGGRAEIADAAAAIGREVAAGRLEPGQDRRVDDRPVPRRAGHARRRPVRPQLRGEPDQQLPAVAVGLRRAGLPRHALARLRPPAPVGGVRGVRLPAAAVRQRLSRPAAPESGGGLLDRSPPRPTSRARQSAHVPKISSVWLTSAKPCSSAIRSAHRSTAGPSTSTVRPQPRQTRWWWCCGLQRR